MSENLHAMDDDTLRRYAEWLGIPAATLRGLRDGSLVVVPREPTQAMEDAALDRDAANEKTLYAGIYRAMLAAAQEPQRRDAPCLRCDGGECQFCAGNER